MLSLALRRVLVSVPVLLTASFVSFWAVRSTFDPAARLAFSRDPEAIGRYRARYGLDDPIPLQWWRWLSNAVRGDLGTSTRTGQAVAPELGRALGVTVQLVLWAVVVATVVAVVVGTYAALRQYSTLDHAVTGVSYVLLAVPPAAFGLLAIQFFAFTLPGWLGLEQGPFSFVGLHSAGRSGFDLDHLRHLFLPVLTLTAQIVASWSRYHRAAMLDVLSAPYVRTARAKGLPRRTVVGRHALRNAVIPLVTVVAVDAGLLFGGVVVTETVFSIPGMGRLFLDALQSGDADTIMGWLVVVAAFVVVFNLVADLLVAVLDPRVRMS